MRRRKLFFFKIFTLEGTRVSFDISAKSQLTRQLYTRIHANTLVFILDEFY